MQRTSPSSRALSNAAISPPSSSAESALRVSGSLSVMVAIPSATSYRTFSAVSCATARIVTASARAWLGFSGAGGGEPEVLLAHMGGPFWARRDKGAWSIPKGEYEEGEDALSAARREFGEELGCQPPRGQPI